MKRCGVKRCPAGAAGTPAGQAEGRPGSKDGSVNGAVSAGTKGVLCQRSRSLPRWAVKRCSAPRCSAVRDAVYLGFSGFNARTGAGNFDADSLEGGGPVLHARGVKVHVALNTTVYGGELASLAAAVEAVAESGADAVICQDLAVAQLIGRIAPDLPRHGSTQMSVHTLAGRAGAGRSWALPGWCWPVS